MIAELIPHQAKREDLEHTPWVGIKSRWVIGCGECAHFEACKREKGVREDTDACQYPPHVREFRSKRIP